MSEPTATVRLYLHGNAGYQGGVAVYKETTRHLPKGGFVSFITKEGRAVFTTLPYTIEFDSVPNWGDTERG